MKPLLPSDPKKLGGWTLTGRLGQGGMGVVYMGNKGGKTVAIKIILAGELQNPRVKKRFFQEVQSLSLLRTRYVAALLDFDLESKNPWYAVEYISDMSLGDVLKTAGSFTGRNWWNLAQNLLMALAAVHNAEVIHRDLKPDNIMISKGIPLLIDFGLAKPITEGIETPIKTLMNQTMGTPHYMSPEQWESAKDVDGKTDIWAIGVTLIEAAGGKPWGEKAANEIKVLIREGKTPDLSSLDPAQKALISVMLKLDPAERWSATNILKNIDNFYNYKEAPASAPKEVVTQKIAQPRNIKAKESSVIVEESANHTGRVAEIPYITRDGKPITLGMKVKYIKTGEFGTVTKYDKTNTNYVYVQLDGAAESKVKSTNQLESINSGAKVGKGHQVIGSPKKSESYTAKERTKHSDYWTQEAFPLARPRERLFAALLDFMICILGVVIVWAIWLFKLRKTGLTPGRKIVGLVIVDAKTHIPVPVKRVYLRGIMFNCAAYGIFVVTDTARFGWTLFLPIIMAMPMIFGKRQAVWDMALKTTVGKFDKTIKEI